MSIFYYWCVSNDLSLNTVPVMTSLGQCLGKTFKSCKGTRTPSMFPNMEDRPRQKSMTKNRTDQSGDKGILVMASVKTIKARPVPSTPCLTRQVSILYHALNMKVEIRSQICDKQSEIHEREERNEDFTWLRNVSRLQVWRLRFWMMLGYVLLSSWNTWL